MTNRLEMRPETEYGGPPIGEHYRGPGLRDIGIEREGGGSAVAAGGPACRPYARGEVAKSRSRHGHLPADVVRHAQGLVIADFGVDWRTPRPTLKNNVTLKSWLRDVLQVVRANPSTAIRITGYSDCVGRERNNTPIRRGRAQRVLQLLQQLAGPQWNVLRGRIRFVGAAPQGTYLADNSTLAGRAMNRGVLIQHITRHDFPPEVITGRNPDSIERIRRRGLELLQQLEHFGTRISTHQQRRIRCFLPKLSRPDFDDRYVTAQGVLDYSNQVRAEPYYASAKQWLLPEFARRAGGQRSDRDIWTALIRIDEDIIQGRHKINYFYATHGAATPVRVQRLRGWVASKERQEGSIYWCYGQQAP